MDRADTQVGTLHLPHLHRLEPVVGGVALVVAVVGLGLLYNVILEEGRVLGQVLVGEAGADLADALVLLVLGVVAGQQETSVPVEEKPLVESKRGLRSEAVTEITLS